MTFVHSSEILRRTLTRPAIFFFALAQLLLAFGPVLDGTQGPDARAHVEAAGTSLHHAHNDADCAACTARHLLASSELLDATEAPTVATVTRAQPHETRAFQTLDWHQSRSRAPPANA